MFSLEVLRRTCHGPQDRWNHQSVKATQALDKLPKKANGDVNWGNIRVAHLDTGYTRHDAFGAWSAGGANAIIEAPGRDFFQPARTSAQDPLSPVTPPQEVGHGTRTGAVLAGRSASGDFLGAAPGLPVVIPNRVTNNRRILEQAAGAIGAALNDIVNKGRCPVVSISQGFPFVLDQAMGEAVDSAYLKGIIICCAAGQFIDRVCYPAKHRRTIGVGGYRKSGRHRKNTHRYSRIDSWSPADNITRPNVPGPRRLQQQWRRHVILHRACLRRRGDVAALPRQRHRPDLWQWRRRSLAPGWKPSASACV